MITIFIVIAFLSAMVIVNVAIAINSLIIRSKAIQKYIPNWKKDPFFLMTLGYFANALMFLIILVAFIVTVQ